jgi:hypothetical protein
MKKILVFMVILANLVFGVQGFSQMNSKEFEKVMAKVAKEYDKGNKQKALSMLKGEIQKNPSNIRLKVMLGMFYNVMGRKNESEKELNEAVELQKKYPYIADNGKKYDVRLVIGILYIYQTDYKKALQWFSEIDNTTFEKIDEMDLVMGTLNYRLGNTEEAKKYLLKSYIKDEEGMSQNILGQIYLAEGNQKEARKWFLESSDKGNSGGQANLGILYYQQRDKNAALKWLKKSFETAKKEKDQKQMKDIQKIIKEVESNN